jgi:hypothetical protein
MHAFTNATPCAATSAVTTSSTLEFHLRTPKRLSVTLPQTTYENLVQKSSWEGRSISNLAAFLLESALTPGS